MIVEETNKIFKVVKECFKTDLELCEKWHIISPNKAYKCAWRTVIDLENTNNLHFYVMKEGDEIAGFFGTESVQGENYLTSYFVKPKYRNKEMITIFWKFVKEKIGDYFLTMIYAKNLRAKKFLEKSGFMFLDSLHEENEILVYASNNCLVTI